jgi:hypothetical protein
LPQFADCEIYIYLINNYFIGLLLLQRQVLLRQWRERKTVGKGSIATFVQIFSYESEIRAFANENSSDIAIHFIMKIFSLPKWAQITK